MTPLQRLWLALADLVLVLHAAFCAFVLLGLVLIWLGRFRGWAFVRNLWFRMAHLACIGVVVAESMLDIVCPLTTWEDRLRLLAGLWSRGLVIVLRQRLDDAGSRHLDRIADARRRRGCR